MSGLTARLAAGLGVLVLALVALGRMTISYEPSQTFPELRIFLHLPSAMPAEEMSRRWVAPVESAVRSLGQVTATRGTVSVHGLDLTVRFEPDTDPVAKSGRLMADLRSLRSELPEGASLSIWPAAISGEEGSALLALIGDGAPAAAPRVASDLESLPGVRQVEVHGGREAGSIVRIRRIPEEAGGLAATVRQALARRGMTRSLGRLREGAREVPVLSGDPAPGTLADMPVPSGGTLVPLSSIASIERGPEPAGSLFRLEGREAVSLLVRKDPVVSPLALDREIRRYARKFTSETTGLELRVIESRAAALWRLLSGAGLGLVIASIAGGLAATWVIGRGAGLLVPLYLLLGSAMGINIYWLAGEQLNATSITSLLVGIGVGLPLAAVKIGGPRAESTVGAGAWLLCSLTPVCAVLLARGELSPAMKGPAVAFGLAAAGAVAAAWILPRPRGEGCPPSIVRAGYRRAMRGPATVTLASLTLAFASFVLFGDRLEPDRRGSPDPDGILISLTLPQGATLEETAGVVEEIESALDDRDLFGSFHSRIRPGRSLTRVLFAEGRGSRESLRKGRIRVGRRLGEAGASMLVTPYYRDGGAAAPLLSEDFETRPETDETAFAYKYVLRSTDLDQLVAAYDRIGSRMGRDLHAERIVEAAWGRPSSVFSLQPVRGAERDDWNRVTASLVEAASAPEPIRSQGGSGDSILVLGPLTPEPGAEEPELEELLRTPPYPGAAVPASLAALSEEPLQPWVARESGRFVLPVRVEFKFTDPGLRMQARERLHTGLASIVMPAGVDLDRPSLLPYVADAADIQAFLLVMLVPALLFAAASFWTNSLGAGLLSLAPAAGGLAAVSVSLAATRRPLDALQIAFVAVALFGASAPGLLFLNRIIRGAGRLAPARAVHGPAQRLLSVTCVSFPPAACLFWVPLHLPGGAPGSWAPGLQSAGVAFTATLGFQLLLLPAASLLVLQLPRLKKASRAARARPAAWEDREGPPALSVRNLTKEYGSGFRALSRVDFDLRPGIVGLLGPNGAGKTTLMRLLTGLIQPTRGQVLFRGVPVEPENLAAFRRHIGYLPQEFNAYPGFTARQFLSYWASERGLPGDAATAREIEDLLVAVGLAEDAGRKVRDFSGGMRQRIGIARALLGRPPVLIVDEPTTGLDVEARNRFREILRGIAAERIVIFSTHIAGDIQAVAGRIILMNRGRILGDLSPQEMISGARGRVFEVIVSDSEARRLSREYSLTARVRVITGLRVRGVAAPGQDLPGEPVEPLLEEAYLARLAAADGGATGEGEALTRFLESGTGLGWRGRSPGPSRAEPG